MHITCLHLCRKVQLSYSISSLSIVEAEVFLDVNNTGTSHSSRTDWQKVKQCLRASWQKETSLGGLEPPTFRLTAERANQLRHRDLLTGRWDGTRKCKTCYPMIRKVSLSTSNTNYSSLRFLSPASACLSELVTWVTIATQSSVWKIMST